MAIFDSIAIVTHAARAVLPLDGDQEERSRLAARFVTNLPKTLRIVFLALVLIAIFTRSMQQHFNQQAANDQD